jgi:hypothetical protein
MLICVSVAIYCIVWLGFIKKARRFEKASPWAAPTMTISGIAAWIS